MEFTGEMVRELRTALVETQEVFAKRLGVGSRMIGHWENGRPINEKTKTLLIRLYVNTLPSRATNVGVFEDPRPAHHGKGGKHAIAVSEVHEALTEFQELVANDQILKALDFVSKKYGIPRAQLRRSFSLMLYLVDNMDPLVGLNTLLKVLSGHEDQG